MQMRFSPKQIQTIRRPFVDSSLEVFEGSPRSGKTTAGAFRYARFLIETEDENHLVLGFSQEQAYKLLIESDGLGLLHIFAGCSWLKDDENGKHLLIKTPKGFRRIYYKGGGDVSSYKSFQGLSLGSVYFCEIDLITLPTIQEAFRRTFASRMRVHFADLNPPSPQHPVIKDVFEVQNTIWTHWTMDDNPILTEERKQELYRIRRKLQAGATGFFTQPFFDMRFLEMYADMLEGLDVHWGVTPVLSERSQSYWEGKNHVIFPKSFEPTLEWSVDFARKVLGFAQRNGNCMYLMPIKSNVTEYLSGILK